MLAADRAEESHGQQHQVGIHREFGAGNRLQPGVDMHGVEPLHVAVFVARELHGGDAPIARLLRVQSNSARRVLNEGMPVVVQASAL
jgi:hypothetical protein